MDFLLSVNPNHFSGQLPTQRYQYITTSGKPHLLVRPGLADLMVQVVASEVVVMWSNGQCKFVMSSAPRYCA